MPCRSRSRTGWPSGSPSAPGRDPPVPASGRKNAGDVRYVDGRPAEVERVLISAQHRDGAESLLTDDLWEHVIEPVVPQELYDARKLRKSLLVNPTGRFVIGGPIGDCGLTGRKIIVDTYGGMAPGWRVQRQGPVEGRPVGGVRRALRGQEPRRGGIGGPARGPGRLCDRGRASGVGDGGDVRHRADRPRADPRADRQTLRSAAGRVPAIPSSASSNLSEDRRVRPLSAGRAATSPGSGPTRRPRCGPPPGSTPPRSRRRRPGYTCGWVSLRSSSALSTVRTICAGSSTPRNEKSNSALPAVSKSTDPTPRTRSSTRWRELTF